MTTSSTQIALVLGLVTVTLQTSPPTRLTTGTSGYYAVEPAGAFDFEVCATNRGKRTVAKIATAFAQSATAMEVEMRDYSRSAPHDSFGIPSRRGAGNGGTGPERLLETLHPEASRRGWKWPTRIM
jgi:hypothetical protein